ncbi:MAG: helicase, partial [Desulfobulbus sp.]|nr:helicase [Desulfobulbus sp.]
MKLVGNTGGNRVIDFIHPGLIQGNQLDVVTSTFSLFAFAEVQNDIKKLEKCRLLLPPTTGDLSVIGSEADRSFRNRLQARWLAGRLIQWIQKKTQIKRAPSPVPQGAFIVRDSSSTPLLALLGSLAFSTDGLGITPGNPLSLIQASETKEEA